MKRLLSLPRWLFGYGDVPYMARPTFRYEMISGLLAAVGTGALLPQFAQLFARKSLLASPLIVALLAAELPAANFFNTFLTQYFLGRRAVPYYVATHTSPRPSWWQSPSCHWTPQAHCHMRCCCFPRRLASAALNVRSSVWHSNFPTSGRGNIFGRLTVTQMAAIAVTAQATGMILDAWPNSYRWIYLVSAAIVVASGVTYSRIRVRYERRILRQSADRPVQLLEGFRLLLKDRAYGNVMLWTMFQGSAFHVVSAVLILVLADRLKVDYSRGNQALTVVPLMVALVAGLWTGRLFDRMGVMAFRALGAAIWTVCWTGLYVGAAAISWPWVLAALAVQGMGRSMDAIWFNIGHTQFASPANSQLYMGIHLTLQGLRE